MLRPVLLTDGRGEPLQQALDYSTIDFVKVHTYIGITYDSVVCCVVGMDQYQRKSELKKY